MSGKIILAALALCLASLIPAALYAQTVHEVEVTGQPDRFIPDLLTIQAGDTVRWVNAAGGNQHDVVSEDDAWTPSVLANEFIFEVTFDDPGSFDYFCTPHDDLRLRCYQTSTNGEPEYDCENKVCRRSRGKHVRA